MVMDIGTGQPTTPVPALRDRFALGVEWPIVIYMAVLHVAALGLCLAFPSVLALVAAAVLYVITGLGITVGYHRLLTHQSFDCARWLERTIALCGLLAGEGPPLYWVVQHRKHHRFSDQADDPHSPLHSFAWAHMLWMFPRVRRGALGADYARWAPRLAQQAFYRWLESAYLWIHLAFALLVFGAGYLAGSWMMAWSFLGYAFFLRMVLVLHATWLVNSLAHRRGGRAYDTPDQSRNNLLVALLALGEGWHNNHHHMQASANHGHRWWQFDPSFLAIVLAAAASQPLAWAGRAHLRPVSGVKVFHAGRQEVRKWFA
jgi:stearoyl-CoA desaturase (delta-9 desaturase)